MLHSNAFQNRNQLLYLPKMNDSFGSAQQNHREKRLLNTQFNGSLSQDWKNDSFQFGSSNDFQAQLDQPHDKPIVDPFPSQFQQVEDGQNDQHQADHSKQLNQQLEVEKSQEKMPQQQTITINDNTQPSKISEQKQTADGSVGSYSCLKSFLELNQKNYRPHILDLKSIYQKVREYGRNSIGNAQMYASFLEGKMKQEIQRLKVLDESDGNQSEYKVIPKIINEVYFDQKMLIQQLIKKRTEKKQKLQTFYKSIKIHYEGILKVISKITQNRQKTMRFIDQSVIKPMNRIQQEMEAIIRYRLSIQRGNPVQCDITKKIRSESPFISKDRYLQLKYLIERQSCYLKFIQLFREKLISLISKIFLKEEILISKTIKQCMLNYSKVYSKYNQSHQQQNISQKVRILQQENTEILLLNDLKIALKSIIPSSLIQIENQQIESIQELEDIINDLSDELQNTIFLKSIEMNNEYILFKSETLWKSCTANSQNERQNLQVQSKNHLITEQCQKLDRNSKDTSKSNRFRVNAVITSNSYLHLQNQDKIATLKIKDIKLSKKGKEIIISNRSNGISSLFAKLQLGKLQFTNPSEVELFSKKISESSKMNRD